MSPISWWPGSTQQAINGVIDPTTGAPAIFTVSTNVNGPTANVYGVEFAVQHVFGASGFGFQANATLVGTNKPYDPRNLSISGFAVTGLADSANLVLFYEKGGFQARIAGNWRDVYLDHFGQQQNNSMFGSEPTFVNGNTQIDFTTSYDITPQLNVYFAGAESHRLHLRHAWPFRRAASGCRGLRPALHAGHALPLLAARAKF